MDRGCNGFIQKPFKRPDLSQKIRKWWIKRIRVLEEDTFF
jgi:hypothetical protein